MARLEGLTREQFADAGLAAQAARVEIVADGNPDPNAMAPQRVAATFADGATLDLAVPVTLGSPERPLDAAGSAAKYGLCRALAPGSCDPRIFDDPIDYLVRT